MDLQRPLPTNPDSFAIPYVDSEYSDRPPLPLQHILYQKEDGTYGFGTFAYSRDIGDFVAINNFDDELETRGTTLEDCQNTIVDCVNSKKDNYDYVFTHNPMGEYGMIDHKMVWELMYTRIDHPLLITDLLQYDTHWPSFNEIPRRIKNDFYQNKIGDYNLDVGIYTDCYNIYNNGNAIMEFWSRLARASLGRVK